MKKVYLIVLAALATVILAACGGGKEGKEDKSR